MLTRVSFSKSYSEINRLQIEGFHVTSYQANFTSHYTRNCHAHVGFLSHSLALENTTKSPRTFNLVHIIIPNW